MAFWTYIRGFVTRIVRSVVKFRQQDVDTDTPKVKVHEILRSLLRMGRSDVDVEKGVHSMPPTAASDKDLSVSSSLGISSILDLMPIPVTTPEERKLAASIRAACDASPARSVTSSPTSPGSPGTPYFPDSPASTTLDTPLSMHSPIHYSPTPNTCATPFLVQCAKFVGIMPYETSVSPSMIPSEFDTSAEFAVVSSPPPRPGRKRWTGNAGFAFPVNRKELFHVTEEEDESFTTAEEDIDDMPATPISHVYAISDSPWSNDEQEIFGVKGKTSWIREMKSLGSFSDSQVWIDVQAF